MSVRIHKPALLDRLPAGHQVIEASAGTGKTYTLQRLVADQVLAGIPLERILVVTFTDKATQELLTRIREYLQKLLDQRESDIETPFWEVDDLGRERLAKALRGFDRATISTIHGFCRQVLQEAALEGKTLFDRELVDARSLFERAFRHALAHTFSQVPDHRLILEASLAQGGRVEAIEEELWSVHNDGGVLLPTFATWETWIGALDLDWFRDPTALLATWKAAGVNANTLRAASEGLACLGAG
ncbi:MAG: UvrD-helicase domain-containing protein [Holophaga sp.]|nr:UvrD-helicase domain-containing protein [Holophaga sp.]